jgi:hypothetical protein
MMVEALQPPQPARECAHRTRGELDWKQEITAISKALELEKETNDVATQWLTFPP